MQVTKLTADLKEKKSTEMCAAFAHRIVLRAALREAEAEKAAVVCAYDILKHTACLSSILDAVVDLSRL